jgi:hypothetical protein
MAETLVEKRVCKECGADVRPNTAFCYNCGKSISFEEPGSNHKDDANDIWFAETLISEGSQEELRAAEMREPEFADLPTIEIGAEVKPEVGELDPIHHSLPVEGGLKSAAAIRRKPKTFQRREVEVVWEEHENPPTSKFILVTLILVLFTIAVFLIAMQMK